MALSIKHPEADRLARELSKITGESLTEAILTALRERLNRTRRERQESALALELDLIRRRCAEIPLLDPRSPEEILGYDDSGVPA